MNRFYLSMSVALGLLFLLHSVSAQSPTTKLKTPVNPDRRNKSDGKAEADRVANERRAEARSLLISLATDARTFRDLKLRARTLARIADVLWGVDAEQGRALFRKAWEAAETADENQGSYTLGQGPLNIGSEVLAMAAKHDRFLAEEFLQKLKSDQDGIKNERSANSLWSLPEALQQRLNLAESLLRSGDIERALQFGDPVLGSVTISTLTFLTHLREYSPTAADQRFAVLLARTQDDMLADANTISLLSSYIFTPQRYVLFNTQGAGDIVDTPSVVPPVNVDPQLRLAFFRTAAGVLLRPQPLSEQDQSTTGIVGKYCAVKHLMPLFDQYAPKEIAGAVRGQLEALKSLVSTVVRQKGNEAAQKEESLDESLSDQEEFLLDQAEAAKTSNERDELYFKLALLALSKNDLKARDYVSKIDESGLRQRAQAWVDWRLAIEAIKQKKIEMGLELARRGELTHIQRLWILTESAKLLAKRDREKALSLLDDATSEARRIEGSDLDRPRGLLAIANALWLIEPSRAWDAIFDAVKAANSAEAFTGEDGALIVSVNSRSGIWTTNEANPDFDVEGIFGAVANTDFERTVQLARGFQGEAPRASATIAIARSMLNEKGSPFPGPGFAPE